MKIRVLFKDPDAAYDCVADAVRDSVTSSTGLADATADEKEAIIEKRIEGARSALGRWLRHGEYLDVEFDLDANTATVLEAK